MNSLNQASREMQGVAKERLHQRYVEHTFIKDINMDGMVDKVTVGLNVGKHSSGNEYVQSAFVKEIKYGKMANLKPGVSFVELKPAEVEYYFKSKYQSSKFQKGTSVVCDYFKYFDKVFGKVEEIKLFATYNGYLPGGELFVGSCAEFPVVDADKDSTIRIFPMLILENGRIFSPKDCKAE